MISSTIRSVYANNKNKMKVIREISNATKSSNAVATTKLSFATPFSDVSYATNQEIEYKKKENGTASNIFQKILSNESLGYAKGVFSNTSEKKSSVSNSLLWVLNSTQLSFSSAESDFCSKHAPSFLKPVPETNLSFASPESDFITSTLPTNANYSILCHQTNLNFATAENDFVSPSIAEISLSEEFAILDEKVNGKYVAFTSPESDFTGVMHVPSFFNNLDHDKMTPLTFSSPESDFIANHIPQEYNAVYPEVNLSFSSPEADFVSANTAEVVSLDMLIPKTLQSALSSNKAVVITECVPPFKITHVNSAWEGLCGFSRAEAIGKTPVELLHGPLTQANRLHGLTNSVKKTQTPAQVVLTNYNKKRDAFENKLTIAPFSIDGVSNVTHLIAVLEPLAAQSSMRM